VKLRDWKSRMITLYCDDGHPEVVIGVLASFLPRFASRLSPEFQLQPDVESWDVDGPHVRELVGVAADLQHAPAAALTLAEEAGGRRDLSCPRCRRYVELGARLPGKRGQIGNRAIIQFARPEATDPAAPIADACKADIKTDRQLNAVAGAGVSRLSLAGLDRMVSW
jgi:hypothetical protein